jgi:hypothetical protein
MYVLEKLLLLYFNDFAAFVLATVGARPVRPDFFMAVWAFGKLRYF